MEILCTTDYEQFKTFIEQRELKPDLIAKITKSMKKYGFDPTKPIDCDEELTVMDGQHRLRVARNLSLPVYYMISPKKSIDQIREMGVASAKWDMTDVVTSFVRQGNEHYKKLLQLKELSGLNWNAFINGCFSELTGGNRRFDITSGKLVITENREKRVLEFLSYHETFKDTFKGWNHRYFVAALSYVTSHPKYNHEIMKTKLEVGMLARLHKCVDIDSYISMLSDIYNYKAQSNRLDFSRATRGVRARWEAEDGTRISKE